MKNTIEWFNDNFMPILKTGNNDCYSCVFRGIRPYCLKMSCWYLDNCRLYSFYWTSKYNIKYNPLPEEVKDFFNNTSRDDVKEISRQSLFSANIKRSVISKGKNK